MPSVRPQLSIFPPAPTGPAKLTLILRRMPPLADAPGAHHGLLRRFAGQGRLEASPPPPADFPPWQWQLLRAATSVSSGDLQPVMGDSVDTAIATTKPAHNNKDARGDIRSDAGNGRFASALLSWLGAGEDLPVGTLMQLQPVHLVAGLDRLDLRSTLQIDPNERQQFAELLRECASPAGFDLRIAGDGGWFLHSPRRLDLKLVAPENIRGAVYETMPAGDDAGALWRLMTELQMLLHDHPLNLARERRGEPHLNGVWPWGAGFSAGAAAASFGQMAAETRPVESPAAPPEESSVTPAAGFPEGFGDEPYLLGLWRLFGAAAQSLPANGDALLDRMRQDAVVVLGATFGQSEDAWKTLEESWLQPLQAALRSGRLKEVRLFHEAFEITVRRTDLLRFWRRPRLPADLPLDLSIELPA